MDPKLRHPGALLAPGATHRSPLSAPGVRSDGSALDEHPAVDDSLVREDSRAELIDGVLRFSPPSEEPHAAINFDLPTVLAPLLKPEYRGAVDMLTRTDRGSNFAPDVSVYPRARDPETGRRQVDELSFEVVSASSMNETGYKAHKLRQRGVRRVFAIDAEVPELLEWDDEANAWKGIPSDAMFEDPCLVQPVPVRALLEGILSDDLVLRGLEAKGSTALAAWGARARAKGFEEGIEKGRAEGALASLRETLCTLLEDRGLLDAVARSRVAECEDEALLRRWIRRSTRAASLAELFA